MDVQNDQGAVLIDALIAYAKHHKLMDDCDEAYTRNQLMDILRIQEPNTNLAAHETSEIPAYPTPILERMLDYSFEKGLLEENTLTHRDLLDTRIMGVFVPKPSEIQKQFTQITEHAGISAATDYFYQLCQKTDYIRMERIQRNLKWEYDSPFGCLEITVNLTKPEKDPKEIAALKNAPQAGYPKCLLCPENVGYAGRINFPARQTLRTLPLTLQGEDWHFQYSPYVYYDEHCIVLKEEHVPMKLTRQTFLRLFDFLKAFPHYFIGSNADLPIVGGSILNHDHFQGGRYVFPMEKAEGEYCLQSDTFPEVEAEVVHWPMSVLRLRARETDALTALSDSILNAWREYSDPDHEILAFTEDESGNKVPHNTITPIARFKEGFYEIDLVLRNNRTSAVHPLGIFHPHQDLHHIKKENIGLIEVMGLFILPGRLQQELRALEGYLTGTAGEEADSLADKGHPLHHHGLWLEGLCERYGTQLSAEQAQEVLRTAVGEKCERVLADAGVFKADQDGRAAFDRFLSQVGLKRLS